MEAKEKDLIEGLRRVADGLLAFEVLLQKRDATKAEWQHFINTHLEHLEKLLKKHTKITSLRRENL